MRRNNGTSLLIIFVIIALLLSGFGIYASGAGKTGVSARAAALFDVSGERFIYTKNYNERLYMASTTKIMTALVAAEALPLDKAVKIPGEAVGTEGSSAYFKEGEEITVEGLLFALLLASANDAAVALAINTAGSVEAFALMMNDRADKIGVTDTNFTNPHGLHDENHYTTAHDLALISAEALKNETVRRIVNEKKMTVSTDLTSRVFYNHNKLLRLYDGACGVKTGFTKNAGRCLVGAAERDGVMLISVTLDAPNDWSDHGRMLDLGFSLLENRTLAKSGDFEYSLPVLDSETGTVRVALARDVNAVLLKSEADPRAEVRLSRYLTYPVSAGDAVGEVVFTKDGREIARGDLIAKESAKPEKRKNIFEKIKNLFNKQ